jgi:hypothetical protein
MTVLLRAGPWRVLLGLLTAGALLGVAGQLLGGAMTSRCLQLGCLLAGVAVAFVLDEPAAEVVDACAVSSARRTALRIGSAGVGVGLVLAVWSVQGVAGVVVLELLGTSLLALAGAAELRRRLPEPGERVGAAVLGVLLTTVFVDPVSRRLPLYPVGPTPDRTYWLWAVLLLAAALGLCAAQRRV